MANLRLVICIIFGLCCWTASHTNVEALDLTILHYNDLNSELKRFKPYPDSGEAGGYPQLVKLLDENSPSGENVLRIAAGNLVAGDNGWLSILGWEKFGDVAKSYKPNVTAFGLKEFESGLARTNAYLESQNASVLISNINNCESFTNVSTDEGKFCTTFRESSQKFQIEDTQIGVVGFVNPLVVDISDPGELTFEDIPTALAYTIEKELMETKTVIAVGSGSIQIAKDILDKVPKVQVVVLSGGSYNMTLEAYPEKYNDKLIVKAQKYGFYLGKLILEIDPSTGKVTNKVGTRLIYNNAFQGDSTAERNLQGYDKSVRNASDTKVGKSLVKLEGTREKCWRAECNLGNLVADAMVNCALRKLPSSSHIDLIGIWTSGSIFDDEVDPGADISLLDVHKWLPYHNRVYKVDISGKLLRQVFSTSGTAIEAPDNGAKDWGQFLQVSGGIEVHYSTTGDLKSLRVHHINASQPMLQDVKDDATYHVVLPSFMVFGRSVYDFLKKPLWGNGNTVNIDFDDTCVTEYIQRLEVLHVGFEERITISDDNGGGSGGDCHCKGSNTGTTVVLTLFIFLLIVGVIFVGWKFVWPRIRQRGHTSHFP